MPLQTSTLSFLKQLTKNNHKAWFDEHRAQYEAARQDFAAFIDSIIAKHAVKDAGIAGLKAKDCMFRINRDVRFSKNKAPYKTNFGASIKQGGKKSVFAGYYFHLEPGASFVGGGIWMPEAAALKKIRQEIDYNFDGLSKLLKAPKFRSVYGDFYTGENQQLSRMPKGYEEDNPAAFYLRLKSFVAIQELDDATIMSAAIEKKTLEAFAALQPVLAFLNETFAE